MSRIRKTLNIPPLDVAFCASQHAVVAPRYVQPCLTLDRSELFALGKFGLTFLKGKRVSFLPLFFARAKKNGVAQKEYMHEGSKELHA